MDTDEIVDGLKRCFTSWDVARSDLEPANVVDVIFSAARNLRLIAEAITPSNAAPATTSSGGQVGSLTEAVMYAGQGLASIANAINDLADAVREQSS